MKIEKRKVAEYVITYVITGRYVPDYDRKTVKIGDLVVIGEDVYIVAPALGGNRVQLVSLTDGCMWSYAEGYDPEKGVPLRKLVGDWVENCFVLKEVKE